MDENFLSIGMMSGTSLDGIDVAALHTDGKNYIQSGAHQSFAYRPEERTILFAALEAAQSLPDAVAPRGDIIAQADELITRRHGDVLKLFLTENSINAADVNMLGFHGQTLRHEPEAGWTLQIGQAERLAATTGINVVSDFRSADMVAGGQGAPLAPLYHAALAAQGKAQKPLAVVNIGGVANITFLGHDGAILGFDTGTGNALLDDWVREHTDQPYDKDGHLAQSGTVAVDKLTALLVHPYFDRSPPKSLDRNTFSAASLVGLSAADGAATLTAFTAHAIARAMAHLPEKPAHWIICGGGRHNLALRAALVEALGQPVTPAEKAGWPGDEMEAQAFAWLAVRVRLGLPTSLPEITGCHQPTSGGVWIKKP